jgi:hypothetical protein
MEVLISVSITVNYYITATLRAVIVSGHEILLRYRYYVPFVSGVARFSGALDQIIIMAASNRNYEVQKNEKRKQKVKGFRNRKQCLLTVHHGISV